MLLLFLSSMGIVMQTAHLNLLTAHLRGLAAQDFRLKLILIPQELNSSYFSSPSLVNSRTTIHYRHFLLPMIQLLQHGIVMAPLLTKVNAPFQALTVKEQRICVVFYIYFIALEVVIVM